MNKHLETLGEAHEIVAQRAEQYGGVSDCFQVIACIATHMLGRNVSPREVAMIQVATKLGRLRYNPEHHDSYVDAINYLAFADQFAQEEKANATPVTNNRPHPSSI